MGCHGSFYVSSYFILIYLLQLSVSTTEAEAVNNGGFSVELFRRNSFHHRLVKSINTIPNTAQSPVTAYLGHYLTKLSFGTPPVDIYGIVDTGSDLIWTSCVPCDNCYKQINPMFDPKKSSTYNNISCQSQQCHKLDTGVCSPENFCNYTYAYASASITQGVLAQETITFVSTTGTPVSLKGIVFGCGHNDTGSFNDHEMGIIGLGGGEVSLISQIGNLIGGKKFSQCLVPFHTDVSISSKMSFGKGSEVLGDGVVSTPLVSKQDKTPYFVTLQGITVGDTYLPFNGTSQGTIPKGNMFIDSGTPPTILPQDLYDRLVAEVKKQVRMKPIEDEPDLGSQLCYRSRTNLEGPILITHFEGADLQLTPTQTFIPPKDGVFCLGMTNTSSDVGIYGNFAQSNYLIGFDLDRQQVSFKPIDCTKQ